jgi:hypothetical protein
MRRLSFWLFFINAEHIAAEKTTLDLASASSRCPCTVPTFPDFGNALAIFSISFTHSDCSANVTILNLRSGDVSSAFCSRMSSLHEAGSVLLRKAGHKAKCRRPSQFRENNAEYL